MLLRCPQWSEMVRQLDKCKSRKCILYRIWMYVVKQWDSLRPWLAIHYSPLNINIATTNSWIISIKHLNFPLILTMRVKLCLYKNVLIMFVSKCKITLSLYHYCVASLPTDTIKIIITHFSINVKDTAKAHTYTHTHTFTITHSKQVEIELWLGR